MSEIRKTIDAYVERMSSGDLAGWVELFTEDAVQEDPIGAPLNVGHDAIRTFRTNVLALGETTVSLVREPIVLGDEAMVFLRAVNRNGGTTVTVPFITDHMTFAPDGRIRTLRAFFDLTEATVERDGPESGA